MIPKTPRLSLLLCFSHAMAMRRAVSATLYDTIHLGNTLVPNSEHLFHDMWFCRLT